MSLQRNHPLRQSVSTARRVTRVALFAMAVTLPPPSAVAEEGVRDWYRDALRHPSESLLRAEAAGRVTIYDGLEQEKNEGALDTQFKRIQSMMFVGVRESTPSTTTRGDEPELKDPWASDCD